MEWLPVVGFEGLYEVSDEGEVRSLDRMTNRIRKRWFPGKVLKQLVHTHNYRKVMMVDKDGERYQRFVHQLVLETFVGPRPEGMECRHLNGDPTDNRIENLCWGTHSENAFDQTRHGTHHRTNGNAKKTACPKCGGAYTTDNSGDRRCVPCRKERRRQREGRQS